MAKNILKNFLLTDIFDNEEGITNDKNIDKDIIYTNENNELENELNSEVDETFELLEENIPKIEFIVEEDENKEKQVRMNFEFKVNESSEIIKIDLEISKNTYLELANELLK